MATPIQWIPFDERNKAQIKRGPHVMTGKLKRLPWTYCKRCGLMNLKNDVSRKALKSECVTLED